MSRIILIVGLLLLIVGVGLLLNKSEVGQDYFSWVGSVASDLNPLKAGIGLNLLSEEDTDVGYTEADINLEELTPEEEEIQPEVVIVENVVVTKEETTHQATLPEIEVEVNRIAVATKEVTKEVSKLVALKEIEKEFKAIAEQAEDINNELNILAEAKAQVDDSEPTVIILGAIPDAA